MRKQCPICRIQVTPVLDGSCPDCGVDLDDAPETVAVESASVTACAACGGFLIGSETACPSCGVILPPRGLPAAPPVGAVLGAPRPKTAEEAKVWAGLPVSWSKEGGDTKPDPVEAPKGNAPPGVAPKGPAVTTPSGVAPPPVPAPFLNAPVAKPPVVPAPVVPAEPPKATLTDLSPPGPTGLELAGEKKPGSKTKDWERKWQRAEMEAKRGKRGGGGGRGGRVVLYLFGLIVVGGVAGAIGAQSMGLLATRTPTPAPEPTATPTPDAEVTQTPEPTVAAPARTPPRVSPTIPPGYDRAKKLQRASSLAAKGKTKDAIREYESILDFEPELAEAHYRIGALRAKLKDYGKACVAYRRYLEIDPEGKWAKEANSGAGRCR